MIDRIGGNALVPESIRQDIIERTDGIPLFIEEMTKAVLEADSQGAIARTVASMPSPALSVPASLHASLMARLDRLGSAKEIAQIGAAIGREFFPRLTGCGRQQVGTRVGIGPGASHGGRVAVSAGSAATLKLFVQARSGAGRGMGWPGRAQRPKTSITAHRSRGLERVIP